MVRLRRVRAEHDLRRLACQLLQVSVLNEHFASSPSRRYCSPLPPLLERRSPLTFISGRRHRHVRTTFPRSLDLTTSGSRDISIRREGTTSGMMATGHVLPTPARIGSRPITPMGSI